MADIPITPGTGGSSVATELVAGRNFQLVEIYGQGGASVLGVNPDRSINVSVIGTIQTTGSVVALVTGTPSISGTVNIGITPGSTVAFQGTVPWIIGSVYGNISGSVIAFQGGTRTTSIVSTVPSSVIVGASIFGQLPAGNAILGAVAASISGTVTTAQSGTVITSVVSTVPSSVLVGASIFGQLPAGTAVLGSVAVLQSTNPWINTNVGSIITIQTGSVITTPIGSTIAVLQAPSIVGTYAEDAAHTTADKGLFSLNVRNDTLASVTSNDGDYGSLSVGPAGEGIVANAPLTKWVRGTADLRVVLGASVQAIPAQGASVFTYITGIQLANMGSASVLVTFTGGLGSILGYSIAPAGGGSNIVYPNALKTGENSGFSASISGTASVLVSAQGFIAKI